MRLECRQRPTGFGLGGLIVTQDEVICAEIEYLEQLATGRDEMLAVLQRLSADIDSGSIVIRHTDGLAARATEHVNAIRAAIAQATGNN